MRELSLLVSAACDGATVKQVLRGEMKLSQHQYSQVKFGQAIFLDGLPVRVHERVCVGQVVTVRLPDDQPTVRIAPERIEIPILYEDEDVFIVHKPARMAVQASDKQPTGTLANAMADRYGPDSYFFRPVNRLDRGTSGLMAVAKNAHAQYRLQSQLHTPDFLREYVAVAEGTVLPAFGRIDAPIDKADGPTIRREVRAGGKTAITQYAVEKQGAYRSLVRLRLFTGRTHQIRVHLAYTGHPVMGDFLYGREDARLPGRFALHACLLSMCHPISGKRMTWDTPPPAEWLSWLDVP